MPNPKNKPEPFNYAAFRGSVLDKVNAPMNKNAILNAPSRIGDTLYYPDGRIVKDAQK